MRDPHADFLGRAQAGVLAQEEVLPAPGPARVAQVGIRPEGQAAGGQEVFRVRAALGEREDRGASGAQDGKSPRGQFDRRAAAVDEAVQDLGARVIRVQADLELLLDARGRFGRLGRAQGERAERLEVHRVVVRAGCQCFEAGIE